MENFENKYVNARMNQSAAELGVTPQTIVELFLSALWKRAIEEGRSDTIRNLIQEYLRNVSKNSSDTARLLSELGIDSYSLKIRGSNVILLSDESEELSEQRDLVLSWKPGSISISLPLLSFEMRNRVSQLMIPDTVETIKDSAFAWMSILEIEFPTRIKEIPFNACCGCHKLETVVLPEGLTKIDDYAFQYCKSLKEISIPSTLTSIGDCAFEGCDALPDETKSKIIAIGGEEAFEKKKMEDKKDDES